MVPEKGGCDRDRIGRFLDGRLEAEEERALERHLDGCPGCREQLGTVAAEPAYWREAERFLPDDAVDLEYTGAVYPGPTGPGEAEARDPMGMVRAVLAALAPTDDPRMLGRLGPYEIVGAVGSGGMGVVLKGFEPALDRYVAIKVLAPHLASSGAARRRFAREAQAAAAVVHENVLAIHGVAEACGLPYLVMPYVAGPSLQRRLDERGPLGLLEVLRVGVQVAAGLAAAHAQGLVHRDIKPANILLENGVERVKITDFGLARAADDASLTVSGLIAGTPQYMSPEQALGGPVDARSDLFSLGSLLYAACAGRPPFRAETALGVLRRITDEPARPLREVAPEVPRWLAEIVGRLHAKDPRARYPDAVEVADLLRRWLAHLQQPDTTPAPARSAGPRAAVRVLGAAALAAAVGLAGYGAARSFLAGPAGEPGVSAPEPVSPVARTAPRIGPPPLDEARWDEQLEAAGRAAESLRREWAGAPPDAADESWDAAAGSVRARLEDLSRRIERDAP